MGGLTPEFNFSDGTYTYNFTATTNANLYITASANVEVTNISVKEITDDTDLPRINYEGFSYQDSLGSELITNLDFEDGWGASNATIDNFNSFTATTSFGYIRLNNILTIGKTYVLKIQGTTTSTGTNAFNIRRYNGSFFYKTGITGTFNETFTFTALDAGIMLSNEGLTTTVINNISIKEYLGQEVVPDSGCGSWLLEPQSTNLITYSEDFSSGSWVKTDCSVVSNFGVSPSGQNNASKFTFTTTNTSARAQYNLGGLTTGNTYTQSYYIKSLGADITLRIGTSASAVGEFTDIIATSEWQRFEFTGIASATTEFPRVQNITGALGVEILVWGAQAEALPYATSYIPTTNGATNTRLQDIATNSGNSTLINSTEGVLYADIAALANDGTDRKITLSDSSLNNVIIFGYSRFSGNINAEVISGGVLQTSGFGATGVTQENNNKFALSWGGGTFKFYLNGILASSYTNVTSPIGMNVLNFSKLSGFEKMYAKTKCLAVWKEALSDEELIALTS